MVVLLIGHGSFDGTQGAFNLPGPDLTVADWNKLLSKFSAQHVAFVNTSSSSGAFLPGIAAPGRVVITATKTGGERNETQFPAFFVEAFVDNAGDRDRNGHVSILEAFEYAKIKVTRHVQAEGPDPHRARDARRWRRWPAWRRPSISASGAPKRRWTRATRR